MKVYADINWTQVEKALDNLRSIYSLQQLGFVEGETCQGLIEAAHAEIKALLE